MVGVAQAAMNAAPVLGGVMLAFTAGQFRGQDFRGMIKEDMDLLDRLAPEATDRRAELQRTIDARIDDLVESNDKSRALRRAARSYQGNWRDFVLFLCGVLFTVVWWGVSHSRDNWLGTFVALILLSLVAGVYAARGLVRVALAWTARRGRAAGPRSDTPG